MKYKFILLVVIPFSINVIAQKTNSTGTSVVRYACDADCIQEHRGGITPAACKGNKDGEGISSPNNQNEKATEKNESEEQGTTTPSV